MTEAQEKELVNFMTAQYKARKEELLKELRELNKQLEGQNGL